MCYIRSLRDTTTVLDVGPSVFQLHTLAWSPRSALFALPFPFHLRWTPTRYLLSAVSLAAMASARPFTPIYFMSHRVFEYLRRKTHNFIVY